ncbi:hypothetical protein Tcan_00924, partial [Toxocara canis]
MKSLRTHQCFHFAVISCQLSSHEVLTYTQLVIRNHFCVSEQRVNNRHSSILHKLLALILINRSICTRTKLLTPSFAVPLCSITFYIETLAIRPAMKQLLS